MIASHITFLIFVTIKGPTGVLQNYLFHKTLHKAYVYAKYSFL